MKVDATQKLCDLQENPLISPDGKSFNDILNGLNQAAAMGSIENIKRLLKAATAEMTVRDACSTALSINIGNKQLSGIEKVKQYELAKRFVIEDKPDLAAEDIVIVKNCVADMYSPLVVGQIWNILDGKSTKTS